MSDDDRSHHGAFLEEVYSPPDDETVEIIAVDLQRNYGHLTQMGESVADDGYVVWLDDAAAIVHRVRELDGQAGSAAGLAIAAITGAMIGIVGTLVVVAVLS